MTVPIRFLSFHSKKNVVPQNYRKKEFGRYLGFGKSKNNSKVKLEQVVSAILYRTKTGCQWRELPMRQFFDTDYSWKSVYYHFQKWSKDGSWDNLWNGLLCQHKSQLDLSSIQLDGTHTIAKRGGQKVGYQGRKKNKTTNLLILSDAQGIPIGCSQPIEGNHNDAYRLNLHSKELFESLESNHIKTQGLFLNADAGFDTNSFRDFCRSRDIFPNIMSNKRNGKNESSMIDDLLYKQRFVIERTNAWVDSFKAALIRFETNYIHWKSLNIIAFICILLLKIKL